MWAGLMSSARAIDPHRFVAPIGAQESGTAATTECWQRSSSIVSVAVRMCRRKRSERQSWNDYCPVKNSAMLGADTAAPGKLFTPLAASVSLNVLWCWNNVCETYPFFA